MPTAQLDDRYFDLDALAEYSGLSAKTLRRHMTDPERPLPNHVIATSGKDRGRVVVYKRDYDAWVQQFPPLRPRVATRRPGMEARVAAAVKSMRG